MLLPFPQEQALSPTTPSAAPADVAAAGGGDAKARPSLGGASRPSPDAVSPSSPAPASSAAAVGPGLLHSPGGSSSVYGPPSESSPVGPLAHEVRQGSPTNRGRPRGRCSPTGAGLQATPYAQQRPLRTSAAQLASPAGSIHSPADSTSAALPISDDDLQRLIVQAARLSVGQMEESLRIDHVIM